MKYDTVHQFMEMEYYAAVKSFRIDILNVYGHGKMVMV